MSGARTDEASSYNLGTRSQAMAETLALIDRLAPTEVTVTITGETGSGKDVVARAIHERSPRAASAFVVFDCGAVSPNLAESELFGHERGSFTGAVGTHAGAFERAQRGTLFLDEVGELPLELQPRLLRVLENRRIRRVGGVADRRLDVRVIAATNRDLWAEVATGRFRQDLYYRLAGAVVAVPPLRARLEDLPSLATRLLGDLGHPELRLSDGAYRMLEQHAWPGNIRELKNVLSCAVAFADASLVDESHLKIHAQTQCRDRDSSLERLPLGGQSLQEIERAAIRQTLTQTAGNKVLAARALGIAVSTLYEKVRKHGL